MAKTAPSPQSRTTRPEDGTDLPVGNWVDRHLPAPVRPYARLMRLDRPIGTWLLLFPCWWSLALAPGPADWHLLLLFVLFGLGAVIMRGAGCTWNDVTDREFDAKVARTRTRPIPSGQVSVRQALLFMVAQMLAGDEDAFDEFFADYFPRLFRFAVLRLRDPDAAEDIVQTSLIAGVRHLGSWRGEATLFTWLCTICRREISAWEKRTSRRVIVSIAGGTLALPLECHPSRET